MMTLRQVLRSPAFQKVAGFLAAEYLRFVWLTNRFRHDPPDLYARVEPDMPLIVAFWHGQHFMMPFVKRKHHRAKVLVSRHRDGEINAIAAERLGVETVRGSGDHGDAFHRKGGVPAFMGMVRALGEGYNMALTADVPKISRKAGMGIVMLARESGRAIVPAAIATSRFARLKNWDRTTIPLPFGRGIIAIGELIRVPEDADEATMEALRQRVEHEISAVEHRAYQMLGFSDAAGDKREA